MTKKKAGIQFYQNSSVTYVKTKDLPYSEIPVSKDTMCSCDMST